MNDLTFLYVSSRLNETGCVVEGGNIVEPPVDLENADFGEFLLEYQNEDGKYLRVLQSPQILICIEEDNIRLIFGKNLSKDKKTYKSSKEDENIKFRLYYNGVVINMEVKEAAISSDTNLTGTLYVK
ncbi:MAG: hypothetical protein N4A44_00555 [Alphaproteobacteria bacterium]|jgi:hypothetical protein|nr:hypothetical protein [Alphaproteobacteria bacterium]